MRREGTTERVEVVSKTDSEVVAEIGRTHIITAAVVPVEVVDITAVVVVAVAVDIVAAAPVAAMVEKEVALAEVAVEDTLELDEAVVMAVEKVMEEEVAGMVEDAVVDTEGDTDEMYLFSAT